MGAVTNIRDRKGNESPNSQATGPKRGAQGKWTVSRTSQKRNMRKQPLKLFMNTWFHPKLCMQKSGHNQPTRDCEN